MDMSTSDQNDKVQLLVNVRLQTVLDARLLHTTALWANAVIFTCMRYPSSRFESILDMLLQRFIYDLAGVPKPNSNDLEEEIDRLLYIETAEKPNFLVPPESRDQLSNLDSEILSIWLTKKFKPALIQLLLGSSDNYHQAKQELNQMDRYNTLVDKCLRAIFVEKHAMELVRDAHFADAKVPTLQHALTDLKKLLTLISEHLNNNSPETMTLFNTDAYTTADITLYNFLKRIGVGKYKDFGLASHVRLCDPLVKFMHRYAKKNSHVIDVSQGDPLVNDSQEPGLLADMVKPATIGLGLILFYIWSRRR